MEGKFCYGRTNAFCNSAKRWGKYGCPCREFQISRKTGYKIFERYEECGLEGLSDDRHGLVTHPTRIENTRNRHASF